MKNKVCILILFFALLSVQNAFAQKWPVEMQLSDDEHWLNIGKVLPTDFYHRDSIRIIKMYFDQPNYWNTLKANYNMKIDLPATVYIDGVKYDSVGVRFKGQTSYSQVQNSDKKSFNLTMDYAIDNQDIEGYKTLNLNNAFQDASFMHEVVYQQLIRKHIPAARSNYSLLYINDQYWGLYANVQQLNKKFYKQWFLTNNGSSWRADTDASKPPWGDGTAGLNFLSTDTTQYQKYYTLKSTEETNPWDYLAKACHALDTTVLANREAVLRNYFDLDRTLWHLATEIAFCDDDSYVYKGKMDYYLYHEVETGRMTPIEYDGNSAFETPFVTLWSPFYNQTKVNYPLMNKLFAVPELRQRYLAHLRTILAEDFINADTDPIVNDFFAKIDPIVKDDPKKIYTYTQFGNEVTALKNFIKNRRTYLYSNSEVSQPTCSINAMSYWVNGSEWSVPGADQAVVVRATVNGGIPGIKYVNLWYSNQIVGNFEKTTMFDDGLHDDEGAGDGIFAATIPGQSADTWVRSYVEAVANNPSLSVSYYPPGAEHDVMVYQVLDANSVVYAQLSDMKLYPNPANGFVIVETNDPKPLQIFDLMGNMLFQAEPNMKHNIDVTGFPSGMFLAKSGNSVVKFLINH